MIPGRWQGHTFHPAAQLNLHGISGHHPAAAVFPARECVLDLSVVEEIDSIGLAALVCLSAEAARQGVALAIHGAGDRIRRLLELYGLQFPKS